MFDRNALGGRHNKMKATVWFGALFISFFGGAHVIGSVDENDCAAQLAGLAGLAHISKQNKNKKIIIV